MGCPVVVAGGTEGFGVGGTGYSVEHFAAGGTGAENVGNSVGGGWCVFWGCKCKFPSQSSLCSSFLQMGQSGPHVQFFAACLGVTITLGIAATQGGASVFIVGTDVGAGIGGVGQSLLVSNRFSEVDPALGQGVPCLIGALGMFSKRGGFWTEELTVGQRTSGN